MVGLAGFDEDYFIKKRADALNYCTGKKVKKIWVEKSKEEEVLNFIRLDFEEASLIIEGDVACDKYYTTIFIEDIIGDFADIVGEEIISIDERRKGYEWCFYEIKTIKGSVTIRFNDNGQSEHYSSRAWQRILMYNNKNHLNDLSDYTSENNWDASSAF
jgi:hypothetical protein